MRGVSFPDMVEYLAQAVLMGKYNQPFSELDNIPLKTAMFLLRLSEAEGKYQESEMKKSESRMKNRGRRLG